MQNKLREFKLFGEKWSIGALSKIKDGRYHSVIYTPDNKLHHVYDISAIELYPNGIDDRACIREVKIYVLTSILDKIENWNFDISEFPNDRTVKSIVDYDGISIKYLDYGDLSKYHVVAWHK